MILNQRFSKNKFIFLPAQEQDGIGGRYWADHCSAPELAEDKRLKKKIISQHKQSEYF